jgi:hypothetical protein
MNTFEKIASLLNSRRFWLLVAGAALFLVYIAAAVAPILGAEIDTSDLPDEEALADRIMAYAEKIAVLLSAIGGLWKLLDFGKETAASYTTRPPGVNDRERFGA